MTGDLLGPVSDRARLRQTESLTDGTDTRQKSDHPCFSVFVNEMVYSTSGLTALQNSQMRLANSLGESPGIGRP